MTLLLGVRIALWLLVAAGVATGCAADPPTWLLGVLMVGGGMALAALGLPIARHLVPDQLIGSNTVTMGAIFAVVGTMYTVVLAFATVAVWENYTDTESTVQAEANALADVERMSRGFPISVRRQVHEAARTYARTVIDEEWPDLGSGTASPFAHAALFELATIYTDMGPRDRQLPLYQSSVDRLNNLDSNRRLRLLAANDSVPSVMWIMLYGGGALTVAMGYLLGIQRDWLQGLIIVALAATIGFSLFLLASMAAPLTGDLRVAPDAFRAVLDGMQNLEQ